MTNFWWPVPKLHLRQLCDVGSAKAPSGSFWSRLTCKQRWRIWKSLATGSSCLSTWKRWDMKFAITKHIKGELKKIREQLYLKNISSSSFISRQLGWFLWIICYLNSIEIEILISKQIGFLLLSLWCCVFSPVKYVVGHGEHPEDPKDQEHLGIQHLAGEILVRNANVYMYVLYMHICIYLCIY